MTPTDNSATLKELLTFHSSRETADMIASLIKKQPALFDQLVTASLSNQYPDCMRAAWAMQICCAEHPEWIAPYIPTHSNAFFKTKYNGVKRNFLKILADHIDVLKLPEPDLIINTAFDIIANPKEAVANRVYGMVIIFQYSKKEPDLANELRAIIEYELPEAKAAFRSRGKKILAALSKAR